MNADSGSGKPQIGDAQEPHEMAMQTGLRRLQASAWPMGRRLLSADARELELSPLTAVTAIDGRYSRASAPLRHSFSEYALIKSRVKVEALWLEALGECGEMAEIPQLSADSVSFLRDMVDNFGVEQAKRVREIERTTNHDVKAVEYFVKERCAEGPAQLRELAEFVHFSCTSEDINNLAYALMLDGARSTVLLPSMDELIDTVSARADDYKDVAMLCRTHGQPATPSTMGKELANFSYRMARQRRQFAQCEILGKMNGAVGNYAAHQVSVPAVNWPELTRGFIEGKLGLRFNPYTTQIEPHDYIAEVCDTHARFNNVVLDLDRDMWGYISLGYFRQKLVAGEIGSSTMPHKVNPIDFENSEGNLGLANATFSHLATKLPVSRFQRDLSDSTVMRGLGTGFAYSLIAHKATLRGLSRVDCNEERLLADLDANWEVLAEPIQTVMRRFGKPSPYEQLKELTRGKRVDRAAMRAFVESLDLPEDVKQGLLELDPPAYTGNSSEMASKAVLSKWRDQA